MRCSPPGSGYSPRTAEATRNIARGGYVLSEAGGKPSAVIIATGSEVQLAVGAQKVLGEQGIAVRVVSMPSTSVFVRQDAAYRESVLPKTVRRIAVEAGVTDIWASMSAWKARCSESIASANPRRPTICSSISALVAQVKSVL